MRAILASQTTPFDALRLLRAGSSPRKERLFWMTSKLTHYRWLPVTGLVGIFLKKLDDQAAFFGGRTTRGKTNDTTITPAMTWIAVEYVPVAWRT
jgi:hypothetical protein